MEDSKQINRKLIKWVDSNKELVFNLVSKLVKIPSEIYGLDGNEGKCQSFISRWLKDLDLVIDAFEPNKVENFEKFPGYCNALGKQNFEGRQNVVAVLKGKGGGKSLILNGHVDVVPKEPMEWSVNPFGGKITDEKIYGRGSFDMKGGLACSMIVLKCLIENNIKLKGDLIFESVVDEESSIAHGTLSTIAKGYTADGAIITEPNNLTISPSSLGGLIFRITYKGKSGMSYSGEETEEPVYPIGRTIVEFEKYLEIIKKDFPPPKLFKPLKKEMPVRLPKVRGGELHKWGTPEDCWVEIFFSPWPGIEDKFKSHFLNYMNNFISKDKVMKKNPPKIELVSRHQYGLDIDENSPLVKTAAESYFEATNKEPKVIGAPFGCDAFMFPMYGNNPAIILGPGGGNAHACDEFVNKKDLIPLTKILLATVINWCGVSS
jgi:acetylornithine deacetylase